MIIRHGKRVKEKQQLNNFGLLIELKVRNVNSICIHYILNYSIVLAIDIMCVCLRVCDINKVQVQLSFIYTKSQFFV